MPEWSEVQGAYRLAGDAHESLNTYMGQVEDGDRAANLDLTIGICMDALLYRIAAHTMRVAFEAQESRA